MSKEPLIVIVGFLGAGKTTLLKKLTQSYLKNDWDVRVILNDYENAKLDSGQFLEFLPSENLESLNGSCICCSGIGELRSLVNETPPRGHGITLIEANGTSDTMTLMEFLGVGIKDQFTPPVQLSVVDARLWQKRGVHNELEASQVQVSSLIVLNHSLSASPQRLSEVKQDLNHLNPKAKIVLFEELNSLEIFKLHAAQSKSSVMNHLKSHWSSCSIELPDPMKKEELIKFMKGLPNGVLRGKGCTRIDEDEHYTFFEKTPSGEISSRRFYGKLVSGPQMVFVGPDSQPEKLKALMTPIH